MEELILIIKLRSDCCARSICVSLLVKKAVGGLWTTTSVIAPRWRNGRKPYNKIDGKEVFGFQTCSSYSSARNAHSLCTLRGAAQSHMFLAGDKQHQTQTRPDASTCCMCPHMAAWLCRSALIHQCQELLCRSLQTTTFDKLYATSAAAFGLSLSGLSPRK